MPNYINLPRCTNNWTQQDINLFNKLPVYLAKVMVDKIPWFGRFTNMLKPIKWQANMGTTMKGVRKVISPILRSQAFPNAMTTAPLKDVIEVRETTEQAVLYRQDFESQLMHFLPSFQDFLTDGVEKTIEDMTQKVMVYAELFYRTAIFHGSPAVWVCGAAPELTPTVYWTGTNVSAAKTTAVIQALCAQVTKTLDLNNVRKLMQVAHDDLDIPCYQGGQSPEGKSGAGLNDKYCLIHSNEVWLNFYDDPYMLANRKLDLDIVTGKFQGDLFGRVVGLCERFELRIAADGTFPAPETIEEDPNAYNYGETVMNPLYVQAPFGVAFFHGEEAYKYIQIGPPPAEFASGKMSMQHFAQLDWNGKVEITQNVMVPCLDGAGNPTQDTNKRGEYLQLIADIALGILPVRRRNIIPVIYRRQRVAANL